MCKNKIKKIFKIPTNTYLIKKHKFLITKTNKNNLFQLTQSDTMIHNDRVFQV